MANPDVLYDYFLVPIMRNGWFNPVNSLVYGIGLIIGMVFVYKLLTRLNVKIDNRLFISLVPFIAFAGVTRTLRDYIYFISAGSPKLNQLFSSSFSAHMQIIQESAYRYLLNATGNPILAFLDSYIIAWFPTPGSYIITFILALVSLFISLAVQKFTKIAYWKTLFVIGFVSFLLHATLLPFTSLIPLLYIGAVSIAWTLLFFSFHLKPVMKTLMKINRKAAEPLKSFFTKINSTILSAHFFDATATFFAIAVFSTAAGHSYSEQHFVSRFLIPFLGPQVMFVLKFVVVIPVLYFINKYVEDKEFRNFMLLVVFILGLAPASRNLARLLVGV